MSANLILMGVIGKPHGVRGLLHVHAYASDPARLAEHALQDERGRAWRLAWRGAGIAELTAQGGGKVADRNAAEKLVNTRLYVSREALPPPDEDEYYLADLIGMEAREDTGALLGTVTAVHDYGAGASLDIARAAGPSLLLPFSKAVVPVVDIAARRLTVRLPEEIAWEAGDGMAGQASPGAPGTGASGREGQAA